MYKEIKSAVAIAIILLTSVLLGGLLLKKIAHDQLAMTAPIATYSTPKNIHKAATPASDIIANNTSKQTAKEVGTAATVSDIAWTTPKPVDDLHLTILYGSPTTYSVVGKITGGEYDGGDMILGTVPVGGAGETETHVRFIGFNKGYILLSRYLPDHKTEFIDLSDSGPTNLVSAPNIIIKDLEFPKMITAPDGKTYALDPQSLSSNPSPPSTWGDSKSKMMKLFDDPIVGTVYKDSILFKEGSLDFFTESRDGTWITYTFTSGIPAIGKGDIIWNDKTASTNRFSYDDPERCGNVMSAAYYEVVDKTPTATLKDVKAVGELKSGGIIYAPKEFSTSDGIANSSPVLYWQDTFGRLFRFVNEKDYTYEGGCGGKPVIYLYPQQEEKVSISLKLKYGFSKTEPTYSDGWTVSAKPDGTLTDLGSGIRYPYLFWEGTLAGYQMPKNGFIVRREDIGTFFQDKLSAIGLNMREIMDFSVFWVNRLREKPYYFITFTLNSDVDTLAPLSINPKPDTVIRVLMDYEPIDHPIDVSPMTLPTIERDGFTVVEWGGILK